MKEAEISTDPQLTNQSLITMDDMFIQIGKLHIDKVNSDKMLMALSKQFNEYKLAVEAKINQLSKIESIADSKVSSISARLQKLSESNNLYQKNNNNLATKIKELSSEIQAFKQEISDKDIEILNLKKEIKTKLTKKPVKRISRTKK